MSSREFPVGVNGLGIEPGLVLRHSASLWAVPLEVVTQREPLLPSAFCAAPAQSALEGEGALLLPLILLLCICRLDFPVTQGHCLQGGRG